MLKVVTFNVWGLPTWINRARKDRYQQIATDFESLDADVALLQEVWTPESLEAVPTGSHWSVVCGAQSAWLLGGSGLVVASRLPVVRASFHPFDAGNLPDSLMTKGALKVTLLLADNQLLNVWNVHLQAGSFPGTRSNQIRQLASWVSSSDDGQFADLIGGDFNSEPDSEQFESLCAHFGPSQFERSGIEPFITFDGGPVPQHRARTLDYIFLKPRVELGKITSRTRSVFAGERIERASDHLGVETVFQFTSETAFHAAGTDDGANLDWIKRSIDLVSAVAD